MMNIHVLILMAAAAGCAPTVASAQQSIIGTYDHWTDYRNGKLCFAASEPVDSRYSDSSGSRHPPLFLVASSPQQQIRNQVSTVPGYLFARGSGVTVTIDRSSRFKMFTDKDTAWTETSDDDATVVNAMRAGTEMVVQGKSIRGTISVDTYSLSGITAALNAIAKVCR